MKKKLKDEDSHSSSSLNEENETSLSHNNDIEENVEKLEKSNTKSKNDINNAKDAIALLEEKIKEFDDMKDEIKKLQNDTEFYQKEIEKLKS